MECDGQLHVYGQPQWPTHEAPYYPMPGGVYVQQALAMSQCCGRWFQTEGGLLQHIRDSAAHRDSSEAQEAMYVLSQMEMQRHMASPTHLPANQCQQGGVWGLDGAWYPLQLQSSLSAHTSHTAGMPSEGVDTDESLHALSYPNSQEGDAAPRVSSADMPSQAQQVNFKEGLVKLKKQAPAKAQAPYESPSGPRRNVARVAPPPRLPQQRVPTLDEFPALGGGAPSTPVTMQRWAPLPVSAHKLRPEAGEFVPIKAPAALRVDAPEWAPPSAPTGPGSGSSSDSCDSAMAPAEDCIAASELQVVVAEE